MLVIEDLVTCYGHITAVKGISLEVATEEIVALIGANGAGKTTVLLSISGVLTPASGTIRFHDEIISGIPAHEIARRGIAQVVEGRGILHSLSVRENLMVGAYRRRDRAAVLRDIDTMFARFPRLAERRLVSAGALSGGEQQMLAIARALLGRPRLLLLDEPSMGLAPLVVDDVFTLIKEIGASGTTILLVEQNAVRALEVSDRAYVMASGAIAAAGRSGDLLDNAQLREAYLGLAAMPAEAHQARIRPANDG
jgi:branched-chain amino acid transport system ATP-binding protein